MAINNFSTNNQVAKILGRGRGEVMAGEDSPNTLYTVPYGKSAKVTSIIACHDGINGSATTDASLKIGVKKTSDTNHFNTAIVWSTITYGTTFTLSEELTLSSGDSIWVMGSTEVSGNLEPCVVFSIFGYEVN